MIDTPVHTVWDEVADFLGTAPSHPQLIEWKLPQEWQDRAHELLYKIKSDIITEEERREVEEFHRVDHLMILIKAKALYEVKNAL